MSVTSVESVEKPVVVLHPLGAAGELYPVPVMVLRNENGTPEHFPVRVRNTFLDIKTPGSAVDFEERIVRSCPVSRQVSLGYDSGESTAAEVFVPKPCVSGDDTFTQEEFCDTSTEVWENEELPHLQSMDPSLDPPCQPERSQAVMQALAPPCVWAPPVGLTTFRFPAAIHPSTAPPQLNAPVLEATKEPPPPPCFSPGEFTKEPISPQPDRYMVQAPTMQLFPSSFTMEERSRQQKAPAPTTRAPNFVVQDCIPPPPQGVPSCDRTAALEATQAESSVGSIGHAEGTCKPCAFHTSGNSKGCASGIYCTFCHLCPPGEKKRRRKVESTKNTGATGGRDVKKAETK